MQSMTGYGRSSLELDGRYLTIEMKSVNNRFLDLSFRLPRAHGFAENVIRKVLSESLLRGHIDVFANFIDNREKKAAISVDEGLASSYIETADKLAKRFNLINDYTAGALMRTAGVITEIPIEDDEAALAALYEKCARECADKLNSMRKTEGEALKIDLLSRAEILKGALLRIKARAPEVAADYNVKLRERIQTALKEVAIDEARLLNEVAFFADKGAIDEETTRLSVHIDNFINLINSNESAGKKMDFIVQEMNRESNTIGSKANDLMLVQEVLILKAEIEKIREQVQNIE